MPLSKKRNRERMRAKRREEKRKKLKELKDRGLSLLPKRTVKRLALQGIDVLKYLRLPAVSQSEHDDLERTLAAKQARIEWQSGGIKMLHGEIAALKARLETIQSTDLALMLQSRVTDLEAEIALMQAQTR